LTPPEAGLFIREGRSCAKALKGEETQSGEAGFFVSHANSVQGTAGLFSAQASTKIFRFI
jgi:hypothetical protein